MITECDNVHDMGDYEFRFIQDPDGIRDLDYNLVENNHRHNSGYALRRYKKFADFLNGGHFIKKYNRYFGKEWERLSHKYIEDLTDLQYVGTWHRELWDKGRVAYFLERGVNKIFHSVFHLNRDRNIQLFLKKNIEYATFPQEKFYSITKKYIEDLFSVANSDGKEFVMADQLVPASNTNHYLKYFNDIKVVCVDRDPRDLYIAEQELYHGNIVPKNVEDFCIWYKVTRAHRAFEQDDPERILRLRFEDMIYHYEECSDLILSFCGIDKVHHVAPKMKFDPSKSIKNTQLYKRFNKRLSDVKTIEKELWPYLYNYE